jgi:ketosteroid isomerase-like protein
VSAATEEITAVILRYGSAVDGRDRQGVLACFTDDVHLSFFDGAVVADGLDAAGQFFDFDRPAALPGVEAILDSTHVWQVGSIALDVDATVSTATATTACVAYLLATAGTETVLVTRGLRYEDGLRLDGGRWRIARRRHIPLWETRCPAESLRR